MGRHTKALTEKEKKFVEGVAQGKTKTRAAIDAGYSKSTAWKKSYAILKRPLVVSALTEALERQGINLDKIVRPIADGLEATVRIMTDKGLVETSLPDHKIRGENADRAIRLLGGYPKDVDPNESRQQEGLTVHFHLHDPKKPEQPDPVDVTPPKTEHINVTFSPVKSEK